MTLRIEVKASCQIRIDFRHLKSLWNSVTDESLGSLNAIWTLTFFINFEFLNPRRSNSLGQLIVLCTFNIQNWYFCSLIRNWIAFKVNKNIFLYYPFCPSLTTRSSSPSLVLIHFTPCNCGSIISGHLSQFVRMVAFSVLIRSLGRFSFCHVATVALSVSKVSGSRFSVILIGTLCSRNDK